MRHTLGELSDTMVASAQVEEITMLRGFCHNEPERKVQAVFVLCSQYFACDHEPQVACGQCAKRRGPLIHCNLGDTIVNS